MNIKSVDIFVTQKIWEFEMNGSVQRLELHIDDFTSKVTVFLNGAIHFTTGIKFLAWQHIISFVINDHQCYIIYAPHSELDLIINGYSLETGKYYDGVSAIKRKYRTELLFFLGGWLVVALSYGFLSGYMQKFVGESPILEFIGIIVFIGVGGFAIKSIIYRNYVKKDV